MKVSYPNAEPSGLQKRRTSDLSVRQHFETGNLKLVFFYFLQWATVAERSLKFYDTRPWVVPGLGDHQIFKLVAQFSKEWNFIEACHH